MDTTSMTSIGSPALWGAFTLFVLVMLALDLGVFHRKAHQVSMAEAMLTSIMWIGLSLAFNGGLFHFFGPDRALEFLTGYLIEKALSVDNLFVFLVIFSYFKVPAKDQHRVLFWGILGALVMRAIFIALGAALVSAFHWVFYIFGVFLIITGIKLLWEKESEVHPEKNFLVRLYQRLVPSTKSFHGSKFFVRENGRRVATPLFLVLFVVEVSDILFAVDSIPAIFAVTTDPFIVYTSNVFAIMGLRSLYFLLAGMMDKFHYLKFGLGLVLAFVGLKMLIADFYVVPIGMSLGIIVALLTGSVLASLIHTPAVKRPE